MRGEVERRGVRGGRRREDKMIERVRGEFWSSHG